MTNADAGGTETPTQMVARLDSYWPYGKNTVAMDLAQQLEACQSQLAAALAQVEELKAVADQYNGTMADRNAEIAALKHDIERAVQASSELATENAQLRARLEEVGRDGERYKYLQNLPVVEAQAFFWNYGSRTERSKAIDAARREAGERG